mgnify:CR=1 FL=1
MASQTKLMTKPEVKKKDKEWADTVKKRDKKCLVCGSKKQLQAHHAIVSKRRGYACRWDTTNGVTLCQYHHIWVLHRMGDWMFMNDFLNLLVEKIGHTEIAKLLLKQRRHK